MFDLRPHWVALVPPVLWTALALVGLWAIDWLLETLDISVDYLALGLSLLIVVAWCYLALIPFLRWRFTMFVLTSDRLITRHGVIAKESKEIPLERVNDVAFKQSVLERIFGAGDLLIESAGERGQTHIENVRRPEQVQLMIYEQIEENNNRMARP